MRVKLGKKDRRLALPLIFREFNLGDGVKDFVEFVAR